MSRTLTIDDDTFEMITEIKQEDEDKKDTVKRIVKGYMEKLKTESGNKTIESDKRLTEYRAPKEDYPGFLKVSAYALDETEQINIRNRLEVLCFRFIIIEADMVVAELYTDSDNVFNEKDLLERIKTLENEGWKW